MEMETTTKQSTTTWGAWGVGGGGGGGCCDVFCFGYPGIIWLPGVYE